MSLDQYRRLNNHPAGAIIAFVIFKLTSVIVVALAAKLLDFALAKLVPLTRPSSIEKDVKSRSAWNPGRTPHLACLPTARVSPSR